MENKPRKSVLSEIAERFGLCARYDERGFRFGPQSWPNTPETVYMMNSAGADIVRRYVNEREVEIGPFEDCISIYNSAMLFGNQQKPPENEEG